MNKVHEIVKMVINRIKEREGIIHCLIEEREEAGD